MKKKILILLIAVVPFITNAATCNNAVTIKSISQNSSSYEEMELESPTIEENKYSACIGSILYYDTETYTKDQVVPLKLIDLRDISSFDSNYDIVCTDEDNYRLCQDTATIDYNTKNVWQYSKTVIDSKEGYSYNENDLEYMNFTNGTYSNFWAESGYFTVKTPNNFIMPNHNLFFKSY